MAMGFGFMEVLLLLVTTGGGNDLLDYIHTKTYWQLKEVGQPNLAALTAELGKAKADEKLSPAAAVRRLMAIRTLGELKDAQAAAALQPLLKSERPFEADYAQQATAALEGKPYARPGAKDFAKDTWLLPAACALVAQLSMAPGKPLDVEKAVKDMGALPGGRIPPNPLAGVTAMLVSVADAVGNIRLHGVTIGLSGKIGPNDGSVVVIARGLYDAQAAKAALLKTGEIKTTVSPLGIEILRPDDHVAILLPSNDCAILVAGANAAELPVDSMLSALKQGKGELTAESDLGKLTKSVDVSQPVWAAIKMTPTYQGADPVFAAFDTVTVVGRMEGDAQKLTLEAVGPDAQKVANAVAEFDKYVSEAKTGLEGAAAQVPFVQPFLDLLKSVRIKSDGGRATVTATMKGLTASGMVPALFLSIPLRRGAQVEHRHGPAPKPDDF